MTKYYMKDNHFHLETEDEWDSLDLKLLENGTVELKCKKSKLQRIRHILTPEQLIEIIVKGFESKERSIEESKLERDMIVEVDGKIWEDRTIF